MATNLQTFSGEVEIPEGNLQLKRILELSTNNASTSNTGILFSRNLGSTSNSNVIVYFDEATDSLRFGHTLNASSDSEIIMDSANVLNVNVFGEVEASYFKGDGGLLSNLVTDLQSVTENGAETDQTLVLTNAVTGIDVQTGNVNVAGNVTASIFFGDGGLLSNITQTLQGITEIGNTTSIALEFNNVTTGFVTTSNVGIVNTAPQHNFSVGSNLYVHDTASNVLTVEGNVSAHRLTLGAIEITPAYGLENVTNISNLAYDTLLFQNASTAFVTTAMAGIGLQPDSSDVGTSGLHVDGHLRLGGQADNTDNELMYIKSAGALGVLANESDTNNTNTDLRLQSGETYNSNITMVGKNSAQYMTFGTNTAERMRIDSSGNVGIGTESPSYKLDVHGTANVGALYSTLTYSNASANIVAWNSSTNEIIDSGLEKGFTEHPVEAMTNPIHYAEGHGTYEADASSKSIWFHSSFGSPFDYVIENNMWESDANWSSSNVYNNANWTTDVGGTRHYGEWLQLKNPYAITLAYTDVYPRALSTNGTSRGPGAGVILGSNDGENWYKLTEFSGKTYTNGVATKIDVNATTPYTWYRIVTSKLANATAIDTRVDIGEWRLFAEKPVTRMENVHISGDLSSETLQTGYIKWPKVPLKAAESEGYVVSASSQFSTDGYASWHAFEDKDEYYANASEPAWAPAQDTFINALADISRTTGEDTFNHEWIQIKLPQSIKLAYFLISRRDETPTFYEVDAVKSGRMYGSSDGITWSKLATFSNLSYTPYYKPRVDVQSTESYNYYRLAVTEAVGLTPVANSVAINELQLFEAATGVGAAPTSAKLQVAGSLGMAKGSEFFAGDDVVMELPRHDRPLVKYPEVAMTAATTAGYTTSASSYYNINNYPPYEAFNGVYGTELDMWISSNYVYLSDGTADTANCATFNGVYGEYLSLSMPKKIKLEKIRVHSRNNPGSSQSPENGRIYGSNDNSTWTQIGTYTGLNMLHNDYRTIIVNASEYYKDYTFQIEKMKQFGTATYTCIAELEYHGTEEGDTSVDVVHRSIPNKPSPQHLAVYWDAGDSNSYSFADSSNVYDLSGSGVTGTITGNNGFDAEYNAWVFDGSGDYVSGTMTTTVDNWVHSISMWVYIDASDANGTLFFAGNGAQYQAIGIRQSGKNKMYYYFFSYDALFNYEAPQNQWVHLVFTYDGGTDAGASSGSYGVSRKFYVDCTEQTLSTVNTGQTLDLQSTSTNFSIGARYDNGGEPFTGKIANVRVFSKKLSIEQIHELYEFDAPRFGHRQNLVSLHKGNLGVGVAHPTSRFEVAGADGLQEYPPKAMTDYETYIEGHGVFRVSASSVYSYYVAWYAFTNIVGTEHISSSVDHYTKTGGIYQGTNGTAGYPGEWISIELPYAIKLSSYSLMPQTTGSDPIYNRRMPITGVILGSNDCMNWDVIHLHSLSLSDYAYNSYTYVKVPETDKSYTHIRLVVTSISPNDTVDGPNYAGHLAIGQWVLFGTPAPSSLEDGHLTLGKALTLPRVSGHPAGAETPRTESLVVHYDTTVDSVVSGTTAVDISGNGINGTLTNGAAYSSTDRALTFDGTDDTISGANISSASGDWVHSTSYWFKLDTLVNGDYFHLIGSDESDPIGTLIYYTDKFTVTAFSTEVWASATSIQANQWYHAVVVYRSGGLNTTNTDIYLNGIKQVLSQYNPTTIDLNGDLYIGSNGSSNFFDGSISNFKIWDVALTAEEVAMEYALGRTGKSLNLTDTALCLGGTVPRAQLDVRGGARFEQVRVGSDVNITHTEPTNPRSVLHLSGDELFQNTVVIDCTATDSWNGNYGGGIMFRQGWYSALPTQMVSTGGIYGVKTVGNGNYGGGLAFYTNNYGGSYTEKMRIKHDGNVGIGVTNPVAALDFGSSIRNRIINLWGSDTGGDSSTSYYGFGINDGTLRYNVDFSTSVHKFYGGSTEFGYVNNATGFVNSFTGQHKSFPHESLFGKTSDDLCGLIVSASGEYISINDKVPQKGQGAIQVSEAIPTVKLSTSEKDKKVFGVISDVEDVETSQRHDRYGAFVSTFEKEPGDSRIYVNSIGEGAMWVTDINGPLESGDYITTSNVAGYGQRQESEFLANYTVAKITMDCDFNPVTQPIQIILKELANVNYWVKTTYSNVTPEEYSNLAEENRTTEDETYYTKDVERKYTYKPTVTVTGDDAWDDVYIFPSDVTYGEWSNLEANVQNTYTLTYTRDDFDGSRYEKTTVSNVTAEDAWDAVHIEPTITYAEYSNLEANVQNTYSVTYTNSTTTSVTAEEYNNLEANVQGEYTLVYWKIVTEEVSDPEGADEHTRTIYKKIEREETKNEPTEDTGEWVLDVRQELVNVLDEHGQLQWEDDPSGATEKAYKIRYLDASGQQTDEANAVHIAAFVGCTYHCG
jgi:hypothetical protein